VEYEGTEYDLKLDAAERPLEPEYDGREKPRGAYERVPDERPLLDPTRPLPAAQASPPKTRLTTRLRDTINGFFITSFRVICGFILPGAGLAFSGACRQRLLLDAK